MMMRALRTVACLGVAVLAASTATAQIDARMFRFPTVSKTQVAFGSGGDAFPTYFRQAGLGPLIGTRTWGGLIGISGAPRLVDGGGVTLPTFRMLDPKGQWFAEGHGVEPDIAVEDDPSQLARGIDPQLQRAIEEVTDAVAKAPMAPGRPPYEKRVAAAGAGR